jgi:hypothetical protein
VLADIVNGVKRVTDVVAQIAASSREQASGIEQVNKAVTAMDANTQQNAALVEEASAAARALTDQAANLTGLIERYQLGDDGQVTAPKGQLVAKTSIPPKASGAPRAVERRAAGRPWSAAPKVAPPSAAEDDAPAAPSKATATGSSDAEWSDF